MTLAKGVKSELICDLCCIHGIGKILFVGEAQEHGVAELVLVEHAVKLITGLTDTIAIIAIHDEDQTLGVLEVMPPERTNLHDKEENR